MPSSTLSFNAGQNSGLSEIAGAPQLCVNALVDGAGAVRQRPGVKTWDYFPTTAPDSNPVVGIYLWDNGSVVRPVYVTQASDGTRSLFHCSAYGTVDSLSDGTTATELAGSGRPVFAGARTMLVISGGGQASKWTGAGNVSLFTGMSPASTATSHVVALAQRLLANEAGPSGRVQYSDAGETTFETTWTNSFEAEARPDRVVALHENTRELFIFGPRTTEVWAPDASTDINIAFVRALTVGTSSPYSTIELDEAFAWLDNRRRFVISDGRSMQILSAPSVSETISGFATVSDAWGFRCRIGAWDLLVWMFPTEGRSLCYDMVGERWSEWRTYTTDGWTAPAIRSYAYWTERNEHLVGLSDGTIGVLDLDTATEDGNPVVVKLVTGFEDHESNSNKHSEALFVPANRGLADPSVNDTPKLELTWRDGVGAYEPPVYLSLGTASDRDVVVEKRSLGVYRKRQWSLTYSAAYPLTIGPVTEQYTALET